MKYVVIPKLGLALRVSPSLEAATRFSVSWGGSLKAAGFGDGLFSG